MPVSKEVTLSLVWGGGDVSKATGALDKAEKKAASLKAALDAVAAAGKAAAGAVAGIKVPSGGKGPGAAPPGGAYTPPMAYPLAYAGGPAYKPPMPGGPSGWMPPTPAAVGMPPWLIGLLSGGIKGGLATVPVYGVIATAAIEMYSKVLGTTYSMIAKSVTDTVGLVGAVGKTIFNLLAAPWRQFGDFMYRFIRWQITWGLIGLGAATEEFVRRSTSAFAEYELTVTKAVTTTGLLGAAAAAAKQEFMALGQQLSMRSMLSATEIAKQFYWLTSAGLTVPQAGRVAPGVIALAQATQAAPEQTSALVMSAMAAFHLEVDQTNRVVNTFAANIGTTLLTLDTLATALPYVGASAYQAGLSFETTNAAIGVLADNGLRASRMGTGLRGMFAALMAPTREAQSVLAKYGLSAKDVNIQSEGLYKVLDRMAPIIKNQADMYLIMGRRTTEAANILISQRDKLRETEAAITGTNRAYEMQNQILSTLAGQWAMLKNVGLALMIQFGGGLGGALKPWVMFLRDFGENLFRTGKAGQLGEKLGQWISAQLTKVGKWILSGDAAKWWDRLVAGARMFWQALVWGYGVLKEVYAILKGLNTPENRALFVVMKDWAVGLVTSGVTTVLGLMAKYIGQLPQALQFMLDLIWKLIPAAIVYAKVWVAIAALKANIMGDLMMTVGAFINLLAVNPITAWMVGGRKQGMELGGGLMSSGWGLAVGANRGAMEAINTLSGVERWLEANPIPPRVVAPIVAAHAAGGEKVASAIERAFAAAAGGVGGVGATAMAAATGGVGGGTGGGYMGGGEGHWSYQYLKGRSGPYRKVWVPAQAPGFGYLAGYGDPWRVPWRARELTASGGGMVMAGTMDTRGFPAGTSSFGWGPTYWRRQQAEAGREFLAHRAEAARIDEMLRMGRVPWVPGSEGTMMGIGAAATGVGMLTPMAGAIVGAAGANAVVDAAAQAAARQYWEGQSEWERKQAEGALGREEYWGHLKVEFAPGLKGTMKYDETRGAKPGAGGYAPGFR